MKSLAACLVFMVFVFVWSNTSSQDLGGCGTNVFPEEYDLKHAGCGYSSDTWLNFFRTPQFWIPCENTPIKTILVN